MQVIKSTSAIKKAIRIARKRKKKIGFVPTMGFLHEGHLSLLRKSKKENDLSVLSIFVNPKQFGKNEDFSTYPRDLKNDELFAKMGKVDIIFYPSVVEMYPKGYLTYVEVEEMDRVLCGPFRPGHFKGVTTVVMKLTNIISPDTIYLGQKDAQQAAIIEKMIKDLNVPTQVKICPTIREKNGLAMSSRNMYLTPHEKNQASIIYKSLRAAKNNILKGERNIASIVQMMRSMIASQGLDRIDYIDCVDARTLKPLTAVQGSVLIALAVWVGRARIIDNVRLQVK